MGRLDLSVFKERLEAWITKFNPTFKDDMLQFVPVQGENTTWGLVLVKASQSPDFPFPVIIDESGLVVEASSSNELSNTDSTVSDQCIAAATPTSEISETDGMPVSIPKATPRLTDWAIEWHLKNKIAWTTHKKHWQQHVILDQGSSLESNVRKYATSSKIFVPSDPIIFCPSHMLDALLDEGNKNKLIEAMRAKLDSPRAFAIVSPSWLSHLGKEEIAKRPNNHVGDILLVTENGSVYLWTIVQYADTVDNVQRTYMLIAGRLTKSLLLGRLKDQREKWNLRVDCYMYNLKGNIVEEPELQQHTKSFFVNTVELKLIQETLAEAIAQKETYLRNVTGEACGYKLSAEQWQLAEKVTRAPVVVVSGPPGSGKTLLCAHFLQEKGMQAQCMYICTNDALAAFMKSQNISSVHVVRTDAELDTLIEQGDFNHKRCITFDDIHRLSCSDQTAKCLLNLIKGNTDVRLYIFCDNKFQCFDEIKNSFPKVVQRCCKRMDIECTTHHLTEIHRNTRRIMSFLSAISFKGEIKCLHKWEGDDVEVLAAENSLDDSPENPVIQNIFHVLGYTNEEKAHRHLHYTAQDIAVLIDTDKPDQDVEYFQEIVRKHIPHVKIHSAATYPRKGIVVDSLDSFHGLDAGVCFYVLSIDKIKEKTVLQKLFSDSCRSIYNPKYLAFLASRAIYKAVFLVPKLNVKVFREMLFDYFDEHDEKVIF